MTPRALNDSTTREGAPGGTVLHPAANPQPSSVPGTGGATVPVSGWTGADLSGVEFCPRCTRSDLALHYYTIPIDFRENLRCSNCNVSPCSSCEVGLIEEGDECGRCLLNTVLAQGWRVELIRYLDAVDLAERWQKRADDCPHIYWPAPMRQPYRAEAERWCETAATLAIVLGDRVGESHRQRVHEVPQALIEQTQACESVLSRVRFLVGAKVGRVK